MQHHMLFRRNKPLFLFICFFVVLSISITGYAEDTSSSAAVDPISSAKEEGLAMTVQTNEISGWPQGPAVSSPAAILMDMDTGTILYGKNTLEHHYPASITKIMTALLAVENGQADQIVTFSHDAVYNIEKGSANVGMMEGEQISLDEALRCMMSASANECAYAIAETIGGTYDNFINMMNNKAAELGCSNSHFCNPHGLYDADHYVSANDMALISAAAYKNAWFRDICALQTYTRPITAMNDNGWCITNKHKMFNQDSPYYYEGCTGGKTGFTNEARNTLVTFAERNGQRLVCVVLQSEGYDVYINTAALFDYGFSSFSNIPISGNADSAIVESADSSAYVTLPRDVPFGDTDFIISVNNGTASGNISYSYNGCSVGNASVTFTDTYLKSLSKPEEDSVQKTVSSQSSTNGDTGIPTNSGTQMPWLPIIAVIAAAVFILISILVIFKYKKKKS